jgi:hypothetical protein
MRLLFLLLLLANLAFYVWHQQQELGPSSSAPADAGGVARLELLHERPRAHRTGAQEGTLSLRCGSIGPFATDQQAGRIAEQLRTAGLRVQPRTAERYEPAGHWVYLPPAADRESASRVSRELAARGVSDYYVVTTSERENAISLGLFRDKWRAEERAAAMRAQGFAPEIEERYQTRFEYWLDYQAPRGQPPDAAIAAAGVADQVVEYPCPR